MAAPPATEPGATRPTRLPHVSPAQIAWLRRAFAVLQALSPALAARLALRLFLKSFRHRLSGEDRAALARARRHRVMAGADPVEVYEWGTGDRTVVILHGWGSSAARFCRMAEVLAARGWHVLVPDAPGHGASPGRSSSLVHFMATLDAIGARFGQPRALIGHSLGALGIARRHAEGPPDWASRLEAVVLISMPSGASFLMEGFLRALALRSAAREALHRLFEKRFNATLDTFAAMPGALQIGARLLVLHDGEDDIVPHSHSAGLMKQLRRAQLVTTSALGHSALTRDAATIRLIAEFLEPAI